MTIQIISLLIALLAVIIGPYISNRSNKKNLEFQFRTKIKEQWVNKLEEAAVSYLNFTMEWIERYRALCDKVKSDPSTSNFVNNEIDRLLNGINSSFIMLQLHLRSEKPEQRVILDKATEMKEIVNKKSFNEEAISNLRECHENIISNLQNIFHKERSKMAETFR